MTAPINDIFTRIRGRTANVIGKYGATIIFYLPDTPAAQNDDGSWTEAVKGNTFDGLAILTRGSPSDLGITRSTVSAMLKAPVTVLVAAVKRDGTAMTGIPAPGMLMDWANVRYKVLENLPIAPNGVPIYYVVTGDI